MILMTCIVVVIAIVGVISVRSTLITKAEAKDVALEDAGLYEADASALRVQLEFEDGRFQYEVDFYSNGTEYEYLIQAKDGDIIARDIDGGAGGNHYGQNLSQDFEKEPAVDGKNSVQADRTGSDANTSSNYIEVDLAKEIALNHANLNESDVRFVKAKLENDDGKAEYEIEFYSGKTEYDYTIDAVSGNIVEYDVDYD